LLACADEKVDEGDSCMNGDGPGGAERSGEELELMEDANYDRC